MSHLRCEDVQQVAAELALGSVTGEERAHALAHVAECAECRALVDELSRTADSLLLLGPLREPPIGFESRALARFAPHHRRFSWRALVAAVLAAALGAGVMFGVTQRMHRRDHRLAAQYEKLIQQIGGRTLRAAELRSINGTPVGKVYAYDGKPSWLFLVLDDSEGDGNFQVEVDPVSGESIRLAGVQIRDGKASWATTAAVAIDEIQSVNIIDSTGVPIYGAQFKSPSGK